MTETKQITYRTRQVREGLAKLLPGATFSNECVGQWRRGRKDRQRSKATGRVKIAGYPGKLDQPRHWDWVDGLVEFTEEGVTEILSWYGLKYDDTAKKAFGSSRS